MKKIYRVFGLVIALLLAVGLALPTGKSEAAVGFHISGRNLLDANGNNFVMRGISHAHTWYPTQTSSFANIKAAGANTVRVVLSGGRWTKNTPADVANVISLCKTNRLICVLEDHDTTGYGEDGAAYTMTQAVNYWKELQSVLTGQEAYIIINIGNEPYGNNNAASWVNDTKNAIAAMRSAGFQHTLMVDAPNWGQDWQFYMRDNAASIFNSDPAKNTILSIHMYGVFDTAAEIQSYLSTFTSSGLPLVIGEFGWNHSDGNPDEDTIMAQAQANGIGYIGWSWSGNGGGVEYLDMVTGFNPSQLSSWGERIINGTNGLKQTSQEASVYGGPITPTTPPPTTPPPTTPPPTTPPPTTPPPTTPPPGTCQVAYVMNQWSNGFTADVKITNNNSSAISGWTLIWVFANGQRVTSSWNATVTQSGSTVTASNPASYWNGTIGANGGSVSFGFQATHTGTNQVPTTFMLNGSPCMGGTVTPPPTTPPPTTPPPTTPPPTTPPPTTPPPTTPPPTTPPPTTPPPTACAVVWTPNTWNNGFTAEVKITNNSSTTIQGWTLVWTFANGQRVTSSWNATVTQSGGTVTASNPASYWNGTIGANGGTASFGIQGTHTGTNNAPASFTLNGVTCSR